MRKLFLDIPLAGLGAFVPVGFDSGASALTVTTASCTEAGSCAPKCDWECIHGDIIREDRCDPNDNGCISVEVDCDGGGDIES